MMSDDLGGLIVHAGVSSLAIKYGMDNSATVGDISMPEPSNLPKLFELKSPGAVALPRDLIVDELPVPEVWRHLAELLPEPGIIDPPAEVGWTLEPNASPGIAILQGQLALRQTVEALVFQDQLSGLALWAIDEEPDDRNG
jgi:hypothetical protein